MGEHRAASRATPPRPRLCVHLDRQEATEVDESAARYNQHRFFNPNRRDPPKSRLGTQACPINLRCFSTAVDIKGLDCCRSSPVGRPVTAKCWSEPRP
jgi:hypothetical protein